MFPHPFATVILDMPTALLFGCVVALASWRLVRQDPEGESRRLAAIGAGWGVLYGFSVAFMYFRYPDWMLTYLKDAKTVPLVPVFIVFLLALAAHGAIGAYANAFLVARGRTGLALLTSLGALLTIAVIFWLQSDQYAAIGTYAEFRAGTAPALPTVKEALIGMNAGGAVATLSALGTIGWRFFRSRKLPA